MIKDVIIALNADDDDCRIYLKDESSNSLKAACEVDVSPALIPRLLEECERLLRSDYYNILNDEEGEMIRVGDYQGTLKHYRERTGMGYKEGRQAFLKYCELHDLDPKEHQNLGGV